MRHRTVVDERVAGLQDLGRERWDNHHKVHFDLAASLADYKVSANEWRATLNDIRGSLVTRTEYQSEHKSLRAELASSIEILEGRVAALERAMQTQVDRDQTTRNLLSSARNLIILGFTITGGLLAIAIYLGR